MTGPNAWVHTVHQHDTTFGLRTGREAWRRKWSRREGTSLRHADPFSRFCPARKVTPKSWLVARRFGCARGNFANRIDRCEALQIDPGPVAFTSRYNSEPCLEIDPRTIVLTMSTDVQQIKEQVVAYSALMGRLKSELRKVIVGQERMVTQLLVGLLTHGHILLEGVPGLAKTTAIKALADALSTRFQRIQFTPDLLPADLIGTMIYQPAEGVFTTRKGPIFANFVLADEINRAPSKVQSALLEAMQERQVTIGDQTYPLAGLFLVMATQNPIEQEGTYPLPEAQVDRFMLKVKIGYPSSEEERQILDLALAGGGEPIQPVLTPQDLAAMQEVVTRIYVDGQVKDYIIQLVQATRYPQKFGLAALQPLIEFGGSPRATIFLGMAARAIAFLRGRGYVTPQDVKDTAPDILRHRIILTFEAEAEQMTTEQVIQRILDTIPVP
jgi:MoxR-like ATPase